MRFLLGESLKSCSVSDLQGPFNCLDIEVSCLPTSVGIADEVRDQLSPPTGAISSWLEPCYVNTFECSVVILSG